MEYIQAAGLLQDVMEAGFQYKNGAAFVRGERTVTRGVSPGSAESTS